MLRIILLVSLVVAVCCFRSLQPMSSRSVRSSIQMNDPFDENDDLVLAPNKFELIPFKREPIVGAASVASAMIGFILSGPILSALFAAVANYCAKRDNDPGRAFRGIGKASIESYNFINEMNAKYNITGQVVGSIDSAISAAAKGSKSIADLRTSFQATTARLIEIDQEFDVVSKGQNVGKAVLYVAGTASDNAIDQLLQLNKKVIYLV